MGSSILVCVRFLDLFGLVCSGFCLQRVNTGCSGCSVDFVEKLWENLRKTLWINCGKSFLDLWKKWFYTTRGLVFHELCKIVESFTRDFTHKLFSVGEEFCTFSTGFITTIINIFRKEGK